MDQTIALVILLIAAIYQASPGLFRRKWKANAPILNSIQLGMNDETYFMQLTKFNLTVFQEQIIQPVKWILSQPVCQIIEWLHDGDYTFSNARSAKLSVEDRVMRSLMVTGNHPPKLLEILWGQKKSTIYEDCWLIMKVFCKIWSNKLKLPLKGTAEYQSRVGQGTFADAFDRAVYVMDGHKV